MTKPLNSRKIVSQHFQERIDRGELGKSYMKELPLKLKGRLLEVGCGNALTYRCNSNEIYALDLVADSIKVLKMDYPQISTVVGDAFYLPFQANSFQVVVATDLLHHLIGQSIAHSRRQIENCFSELIRVIETDGVIIIRELVTRNSMFSNIMYLTTSFCARMGLEFDFFDVHSNVIAYFLSEDELYKLFNKYNLTITILMEKNWEFRHVLLGKRIEIMLTSSNLS